MKGSEIFAVARQGHHLRMSQILKEDEVVKHNVGRIDRIARVVIGLGLIALAFIGPKTALGWIGLLPLITGLVGICPAYSLFGLSTCPRSSR